jgi:hypothetical protein
VNGVLMDDEQPSATVRTVYTVVLAGVTLNVEVVSPVLQMLPVGAELTRVVLLPVQRLAEEPFPRVMLGVGGIGLTVTTTAWLMADEQPFATACAV